MHTPVLKMCYPHRFPFLRKTPPLFYHYHSLLELQKHRLWQLLSYLLPIHLDLTECTIYIHSLHYPESCPSLSSPSPSLEPYPTNTQPLTPENLNLIQRILELIYPNFTTALCHTSLKGQPPLPKLSSYPEHRQ